MGGQIAIFYQILSQGAVIFFKCPQFTKAGAQVGQSRGIVVIFVLLGAMMAHC